jgi:hypothetical protein
MKRADLESRSMITQIKSSLQAVIGKLMMKSMLILSHFYYGILNGCNSPPVTLGVSQHVRYQHHYPIRSCHITIRPTFHIITNFLNDLSHSYDINLKFYFHRCVLRNEINKRRAHLYMFFLIKLTYRRFKSSPSICSS